jgi:hypothetical protein
MLAAVPPNCANVWPALLPCCLALHQAGRPRLVLGANPIVLSCHLSSKHARSCLGKLGTYSDYETFVPIDLKCLWIDFLQSNEEHSSKKRNYHSVSNASQTLNDPTNSYAFCPRTTSPIPTLQDAARRSCRHQKRKKNVYVRVNTISTPPIRRPIDDVVRRRRSCCPGAGTPPPPPPPPPRRRRRR